MQGVCAISAGLRGENGVVGQPAPDHSPRHRQAGRLRRDASRDRQPRADRQIEFLGPLLLHPVVHALDEMCHGVVGHTGVHAGRDRSETPHTVTGADGAIVHGHGAKAGGGHAWRGRPHLAGHVGIGVVGTGVEQLQSQLKRLARFGVTVAIAARRVIHAIVHEIQPGGGHMAHFEIVDVPTGGRDRRVGFQAEPQPDDGVGETADVDIDLLPAHRGALYRRAAGEEVGVARDIVPAAAVVEFDEARVTVLALQFRGHDLMPRPEREPRRRRDMNGRTDQGSVGEVRIAPVQNRPPAPLTRHRLRRPIRRFAVLPAGDVSDVRHRPALRAVVKSVLVSGHALLRDQNGIVVGIGIVQAGRIGVCVPRVIERHNTHAVGGQGLERRQDNRVGVKHLPGDHDRGLHIGRGAHERAAGQRHAVADNHKGVRRFIREPGHRAAVLRHVRHRHAGDHGRRVVDRHSDLAAIGLRVHIPRHERVAFHRRGAGHELERVGEDAGAVHRVERRVGLAPARGREWHVRRRDPDRHLHAGRVDGGVVDLHTHQPVGAVGLAIEFERADKAVALDRDLGVAEQVALVKDPTYAGTVDIGGIELMRVRIHQP